MFIKRVLINGAIKTIEILLTGITDSADLSKIIKSLTDLLKKIAGVLTDDDSTNRIEVQGVWSKNKQQVSLESLDLIEITVKEKIQNSHLQEAALVQVKTLKQILSLNQED